MSESLATRPVALGYIRVRPLRKISPKEKLVGALLARGYTVMEIAQLTESKEMNIRTVIFQLASKLPGDLQAEARIKTWMRGASYGTMTGGHLPPLPDLHAALEEFRQKPAPLGKLPGTP